MPKWLRRHFIRGDLKFHFVVALAVGFLLRLLSAWFVYGPQALDDYKHGVWPAYQFFAGEVMDLPDYRSHILIWLLAGFLKIGSWFGVESALAQVRTMYIGLASVSLLAIVGTYLFATSFKRRAGIVAMYLVALYPLMPFVSTRAFGEAVSLSLVTLAFGVLESTRRRYPNRLTFWLVGFLILGVATLFRFHVGLLFVSYGLILIYLRLWSGVTGGLIAGASTVLMQAAVDSLSGKALMGTLVAYIAANEGGAAQYGVSPWYNHVLLVLGLALVPFSFGLFRYSKSLWNKHWPLLIPFLIFLMAHSATPHKEERFMYPVVGLQLWFIAALWIAGARDRWVRRFFAPALLVVTVILLPVFCLVNTQEGEIEPPAYVEKKYKRVIYLDHESLFGLSRFQFYFLRPPSQFEKVERFELNAIRVDQALHDHPNLPVVVLLTSNPEAKDELQAIAGIKTLNAECLQLRTAGSPVDRLIYAMNPKHNQRRRPTWYLVCERRNSL